MNTITHGELLDLIRAGQYDDEYQIYLSCADNGHGLSITDGKPLKTYEEWLQS